MHGHSKSPANIRASAVAFSFFLDQNRGVMATNASSTPTQEDFAALHKDARRAMQKGDYAMAAGLFIALVDRGSDRIDAMLRAARCFEMLGDTESAVGWYLRAAEAYADDDYGMEALATLRLCKRINPNVGSDFRRILEKCERSKYINLNELDPGLLSDKERAARQIKFNEIFSRIAGVNLERVLDLLEYRDLEPGDYLCRQGDVADSLYFVTSGKLHAERASANGVQHLGEALPGDIAGEIAYFTGGRRSASMRSTGRTELLQLRYADLDRIAAYLPELKARLERLYSERILIRQLATLPLFERFGFDVLKAVAVDMRVIQVPAGRLLFSEGDVGQDLIFVRFGYLAVLLDISGHQHLLKIKSSGALIGEVSVVNHGRRTATVRAITDCQLMVLPGDKYSAFCQNYPVVLSRLKKDRGEQFRQSRDFVRRTMRLDGNDSCADYLVDL